MSRPPRIEFDGAWYHIMNRGAGRKQVFLDDKDRQRFLDLLGAIREAWNVEVHAYSLMGNHFHLLIHTPNSNLSKAMRHLSAEYTQFFNRKHKTDGSLFRGRFKSILAEKDAYFLALVRYIHLNPVKAGLCQVPDQHPWTSHAAYLKKNKRPEWLVTDEVLREFGEKETPAIKRLHNYVLSDTAPDLVKVIECKRRLAILGSDGFRDWVKMNLLDKVKRERKIPAIRLAKQQRVPPEQILRLIATQYQIQPADILKPSGRASNHPKSIAMELLRVVNHMSHAKIAQFLKMKNQAVSKNLQRLKQNRIQNEELHERIKTMSRYLLSHVQS